MPSIAALSVSLLPRILFAIHTCKHTSRTSRNQPCVCRPENSIDLLGMKIPWWYFLMWWLPNGNLPFLTAIISLLYVYVLLCCRMRVGVCMRAHMSDSSQKQNKRVYAPHLRWYSLDQPNVFGKANELWKLGKYLFDTHAQRTKDKLNEFPVHFRNFTEVNCSNVLRQ